MSKSEFAESLGTAILWLIKFHLLIFIWTIPDGCVDKKIESTSLYRTMKFGYDIGKRIGN